MKHSLLILATVAVAVSARAAPLPPADSFRLTIEEPVQSSYCRVVRLKVQARPTAEMMALRFESGEAGSVGLDWTLKGKAREGAMTFASVLCETSSVCHVTWLLQNSPGGSSATSHGTCDLAPGATLKSAVAITVTNGLYKLNRPLVLGKRNGQTMRLVVGSWNWEKLAQNK